MELVRRADSVIYVNYSTQPYTAVTDKDYVSINGTLVWGIGESGKKDVRVSIVDDKV